jgi:hypothetical protein
MRQKYKSIIEQGEEKVSIPKKNLENRKSRLCRIKIPKEKYDYDTDYANILDNNARKLVTKRKFPITRICYALGSL